MPISCSLSTSVHEGRIGIVPRRDSRPGSARLPQAGGGSREHLTHMLFFAESDAPTLDFLVKVNSDFGSAVGPFMIDLGAMAARNRLSGSTCRNGVSARRSHRSCPASILPSSRVSSMLSSGFGGSMRKSRPGSKGAKHKPVHIDDRHKPDIRLSVSLIAAAPRSS